MRYPISFEEHEGEYILSNKSLVKGKCPCSFVPITIFNHYFICLALILMGPY
jgi:hypothetical protein